MLTRDSYVWWVTLAGALVAYLVAAEKAPADWGYREWLQLAAAIVGWLSGKLAWSPLKLKNGGTGVNPARFVPVLIVGAVLASSCAAHPRVWVPAAETSVKVGAALFKAQDAEMALWEAKVMPEPVHREFNKRLVIALRAGERFNNAVLAWKTTPMSVEEITALALAVQDAIAEVRAIIGGISGGEKVDTALTEASAEVLRTLVLTKGGAS